MPPPELWEEILLRLPPDDPASLLRASLVCKAWRRIVSHRGFLRRFVELHRARPPPLLGFLHNNRGIPGFVPTTTTASPFSPPSPEGRNTYFLDCRHGRALLLVSFRRMFRGDLLVWEPITGYQRRVRVPAALDHATSANAAIICAADGCDQWDCHGGPFRVVVVFCHDDDDEEPVTSACEYSSETGEWGEVISTSLASWILLLAPTLWGNSMYFPCNNGKILKYDMGGQGLAVISNPAFNAFGRAARNWGDFILMQAEDGELEVAGIDKLSLHLWSWVGGGDAGWLQNRIIHLKDVLPGAESAMRCINLIGFAEGANVIFLETPDGVFTFELKTGRARKVCWNRDFCNVFPFISFYTLVSR